METTDYLECMTKRKSYQNLCDAAQVLFIHLNMLIKKQEKQKSKNKNLSIQHYSVDKLSWKKINKKKKVINKTKASFKRPM